MKHSQILKRAWHIVWQYRALWIFGIILAITTASPGNQNRFEFNDGGETDRASEMQLNPDEPLWPQLYDEMKSGWQDANAEMNRYLFPNQPDKTWQMWMWVLIITLLVLGLIGRVLRYVAEAALIKMVNLYEETGEKLKARQGWRLGWSRQGWRLFLIDLVIYLPLFILFALMMVIAFAPIISIAAGMQMKNVVGLVTSIGLVILFGLIGLVLMAMISLVKPIVFRKAVLEDLPLGVSFREGYRMFRSAWKEFGLMWLILKGINIVWPLVMIPFALLTGAIALVLGGGFAFLMGGEGVFQSDPIAIGPIILAVFLLVVLVGVPLAILTGLRDTFQSTSWTLTYREIRSLKELENGDAPLLEAQPAG